MFKQYKEYFKIAVKNLKSRPLRSWLTILGIVIGVFLIISLLSLSQGLKDAVMTHLKMIGKDIIVVFPGEISDLMTTFIGGLEITEENIETIKKTDGVAEVLPLVYRAVIVKYQGKSKTLLLSGHPWKNSLELYKTDLGWSLTEGRWPAPGKREIIVGSSVPKDIFPDLKVGTLFTIHGRQFEIAGILKSLGSKQDDSMLSVDLNLFREITGERKGAQAATVKIKPEYSVDQVAENIKNNLAETAKKRKGEELIPFSVLTSEKAGEIIGSILAIIQLAVFGFASIAIIVGGIGIMNTMYTSVRERTREIGILKAVGAKSSAITSIFLFESGIIGLIGGIGGIIPGLVLAKLIEFYAQIHPVFYIKASVSPSIIFFGLTFSFLIGCLSGFFPARQASKMNPIDALKYE